MYIEINGCSTDKEEFNKKEKTMNRKIWVGDRLKLKCNSQSLSEKKNSLILKGNNA